MKANEGDEDGREGSNQIACAAGQTEESDAMKEIFSYACVLTKTECIELLESKEIVRLRADRPKIGPARRRLLVAKFFLTTTYSVAHNKMQGFPADRKSVV